MSVTIVEGLAEAYSALTGLETVQMGSRIMVNNSGTWTSVSESVIYDAITRGGAKIVGGTQYISQGASKIVGVGSEYSTIIGSNVATPIGTAPIDTRYLFKLPQQYSGNTLVTAQKISNGARAALQNSGAQISETILQPVTKMEIVQSTGTTALKTTAKGIMTKIPWSAVMNAVSVAQGVQLGIDFVEANPQLATKISNAVFGTDIDPNYIAEVVENTTVWANIRDGAVFIAEDIVEAMKAVYIDEGVFEGSYNGGYYYGVNGQCDILFTASYAGTSDTFKLYSQNLTITKTNPNQKIYLCCQKPAKATNYDNTVASYSMFVAFVSDYPFSCEGLLGVSRAFNGEAPDPELSTFKQDATWLTGPTDDRVYGIRFANNNIGKTNIGSGDIQFRSVESIIVGGNLFDGVFSLPDSNLSSNTYWNIWTDYIYNYVRSGDREHEIPAPSPGGNIPGVSIISGAILPQKGRPVKDDYPSWYNNGVDTLNDYDPSTDTPDYKKWYPLNIFQPTGQDDAQDGEVKTEDEMKDTINTVDESIEDNLQNDPETEPQPSTYPDPNPEPGTDTQLVNPVPPTIDPSDGESPDPTVPVLTTALTSGLSFIYNPTLTQTKALGRKLWTLNFIENLKKIFVNPMEAIIGFHILYATPKTAQEEEIVLGFYGTGVNSKIVTNQYVTIDCGRVAVNEWFKDARDYEPYTDVSVYMPFIGVVDLKANDVVNSYLHIFYNVDVLTGTCIGFIEVIKKGVSATVYQYIGNCAVQLPLSSGNYTAVITSLLSVASSTVGGAMIGGVPGAAFGGFKGAAINAARSKGKVIQSGNLGSNAGAMAIRKPFLIIRRPVTKDAYSYNAQYGYPANKWVMLGNMKGYTRVKSVHIDFINCTDEEEQMIDSLLKEGVQF